MIFQRTANYADYAGIAGYIYLATPSNTTYNKQLVWSKVI